MQRDRVGAGVGDPRFSGALMEVNDGWGESWASKGDLKVNSSVLL